MSAATNLPEFDAKVKAWFAAVHKAAEQAAVGLAQHAFNQVLRTTAQYSGTTAANWKMAVGFKDTSYERDPLGFKGNRMPMFHVGSQHAIGHARANSTGSLAGFKLGDTIYITNSTVSFNREDFNASMGTNIAQRLEAGDVTLRPINGDAYHMARRAAQHLQNQFQIINKAGLARLGRYGS